MRLQRAGAVAGLLAALVIAAAWIPTRSAMAASSKLTMVLEIQRIGQQTTDLGAPGPSVGDLTVSWGDAYDTAGRKVGYWGESCPTVRPDGTVQCLTSAVLAGGQITFQGLALLSAPNNTIAISGGTGGYSSIRGEVRVAGTGVDTEEITLSYTL